MHGAHRARLLPAVVLDPVQCVCRDHRPSRLTSDHDECNALCTSRRSRTLRARALDVKGCLSLKAVHVAHMHGYLLPECPRSCSAATRRATRAVHAHVAAATHVNPAWGCHRRSRAATPAAGPGRQWGRLAPHPTAAAGCQVGASRLRAPCWSERRPRRRPARARGQRRRHPCCGRLPPLQQRQPQALQRRRQRRRWLTARHYSGRR